MSITRIVIGVPIYCTLQKIKVDKLKNTTSRQLLSIKMSTFSIYMTATVILTLITILVNFTNIYNNSLQMREFQQQTNKNLICYKL